MPDRKQSTNPRRYANKETQDEKLCQALPYHRGIFNGPLYKLTQQVFKREERSFNGFLCIPLYALCIENEESTTRGVKRMRG